MEREQEKKLLDRFGLRHYDLQAEDLLLAIMSKLLEIEDRIENLGRQSGVERPPPEIKSW